MKKYIHKLFQSFGFDIIRHRPHIVENSRYSKKLELCSTKLGNFFVPADAKADCIANAMRCGEIYDRAIYEVAIQYIKENTIALDVGSNFGQMAIMFSKHVGVDGMVYAFEADDFIFEILEKNIQQNNAKVVPHYGAVHNLNKNTLYFPQQDFVRFSAYGSYGIDYKNGQGRAVPTLTIDSLNFEKTVSFMKVDVQGGDLFAMQGAKKTIERFRMPILFEYEYIFEEEQDFNFQQYVDFVNEIDYVFVKVIQGQNYLILPREGLKNV